MSPAEKDLYDRTTAYIAKQYNQARILNRSAARLAMSVFQRRLASSSLALMRSFDRRILKLDAHIEALRSGEVSVEEFNRRQQALRLQDTLDERTADEEEATDGRERNEAEEERALAGVVAVGLADLMIERKAVEELRALASSVFQAGEEAKFERLREVLAESGFVGEKFIIFTEHRDTLDFLVRRLEGLGHADRIAQIHGGMDYRLREGQVDRFRSTTPEGAQFLVATDAAGEGINLQFCWLMVNYDIPWNPARLEQRMGRIHRYGQKHDPVHILNLVAGKTREGRVLKTLLDKLDLIRQELRSDKVFDVIGRIFEGLSLKTYLERCVSDPAGENQAVAAIEEAL